MNADTIRAAELRSEAEERVGKGQLYAGDFSNWVSTEEAGRIFSSVVFLDAQNPADKVTLDEAIEDLNLALGSLMLNLASFHNFEITASSLLDHDLREAALRELRILRISRIR